MFLVWVRRRWSVWDVQHWADVRLSFRLLLYFSIMLCSTGPVFIFLSWMKFQMFPPFSDRVQRDVNSCASSQYINWNAHTTLSASRVPLYSYSFTFIQQKSNICDENIIYVLNPLTIRFSAFKESLNNVVPFELNKSHLFASHLLHCSCCMFVTVQPAGSSHCYSCVCHVFFSFFFFFTQYPVFVMFSLDWRLKIYFDAVENLV